jgi:DNA-binding transcriptional ArsR family regulator
MDAAGMAAAIGDPARAKMLYCLVDGRARTSTELATIADVSPSTASVHLARLRKHRLVKVLSSGRHRYYSLQSIEVARALEALTVAAGGAGDIFVPNTPSHLRSARICYDHMAGHTAVLLRERLESLEWLCAGSEREDAYDLTPAGAKALTAMGIEIDALRLRRRRFAYACVDWSERRAHVAGALGDALLRFALRQKWFERYLDSRALRVTQLGRRQLQAQFGLQLSSATAVEVPPAATTACSRQL